ncbi:hypothetical protein JCM5353_003510 [Sporobolomyces roseus]
MSSRTLASTSRLIASTSSSSSTCSCIIPRTPFRAISTTSSRPASSSLPPPLPHHAHHSTLEPPRELKESSSVPDETSALSLLKSQPSHYVSALLMGRRYLLTPNDILTIPHLKSVPVGTKISLTRILEVGSRDYTLRASSPTSQIASATSQSLLANSLPLSQQKLPLMSRNVSVGGVPKDWQRHPDSLPYLGEELVRAELTVVEHTKGEMFKVEKFKRRKGYRRELRSKLEFTKLKMGQIVLGGGGNEN